MRRCNPDAGHGEGVRRTKHTGYPGLGLELAVPRPPVARRRLGLALQPPTHANQHAERRRRRGSSVAATRCGQPVLAALSRLGALLPCQLHHHSSLDLQHRQAQQPARPRQRDCIQPPARVLGGGDVGGGDRQLERGRVRRAVHRERDPVLGRPARLSESRAQPRDRRRGHGRDGRGQLDALRHECAAFLFGIDAAATADAVAAVAAVSTAVAPVVLPLLLRRPLRGRLTCRKNQRLARLQKVELGDVCEPAVHLVRREAGAGSAEEGRHHCHARGA
mmetsp:Transcript_37068/g.118864  ORF Transcript_37068/g.118864 Transcript_37068/m.118864 type:complete len:277 (+) Transcript_37068:525-1355(+)